MKSTRFRPFQVLSMACAALLASQSASAVNQQEVYAKAGLPGVGVGYAYSFNDSFGLRADVSTMGSFNRDGKAGKLSYAADMKADQFGAYADWFPFAGGMRVSAGVHQRTLAIGVEGLATNGVISIGDLEIPQLDPTDSVQGRVQWSKVAPYLGIGWGHGAHQGKGFGFVADVGVSFGAPSTSLTVSDSLRSKLNQLATVRPELSIDAELEKQRRELADDLEKITVFPQVFVGMSYRF